MSGLLENSAQARTHQRVVVRKHQCGHSPSVVRRQGNWHRSLAESILPCSTAAAGRTAEVTWLPVPISPTSAR
jgi:hypothetical protein